MIYALLDYSIIAEALAGNWIQMKAQTKAVSFICLLFIVYSLKFLNSFTFLLC